MQFWHLRLFCASKFLHGTFNKWWFARNNKRKMSKHCTLSIKRQQYHNSFAIFDWIFSRNFVNCFVGTVSGPVHTHPGTEQYSPVQEPSSLSVWLKAQLWCFSFVSLLQRGLSTVLLKLHLELQIATSSNSLNGFQLFKGRFRFVNSREMSPDTATLPVGPARSFVWVFLCIARSKISRTNPRCEQIPSLGAPLSAADHAQEEASEARPAHHVQVEIGAVVARGEQASRNPVRVRPWVRVMCLPPNIPWKGLQCVKMTTEAKFRRTPPILGFPCDQNVTKSRKQLSKVTDGWHGTYEYVRRVGHRIRRVRARLAQNCGFLVHPCRKFVSYWPRLWMLMGRVVTTKNVDTSTSMGAIWAWSGVRFVVIFFLLVNAFARLHIVTELKNTIKSDGRMVYIVMSNQTTKFEIVCACSSFTTHILAVVSLDVETVAISAVNTWVFSNAKIVANMPTVAQAVLRVNRIPLLKTPSMFWCTFSTASCKQMWNQGVQILWFVFRTLDFLDTDLCGSKTAKVLSKVIATRHQELNCGTQYCRKLMPRHSAECTLFTEAPRTKFDSRMVCTMAVTSRTMLSVTANVVRYTAVLSCFKSVLTVTRKDSVFPRNPKVMKMAFTTNKTTSLFLVEPGAESPNALLSKSSILSQLCHTSIQCHKLFLESDVQYE